MNIKTQQLGVKWPPNWSCDMALEGLFKGYNFSFENSSIKACMQKLQAHNFVRFITSQNQKKLGFLPKSCGIFCHFDATLLLVMGYSNINEA